MSESKRAESDKRPLALVTQLVEWGPLNPGLHVQVMSGASQHS